MIKVYYAPPSIFGRKVLAVLEEKELDYTIEKMSFKEADHKKDEYLNLNPNGEIPTLADEEFVVYESTAIIEYLEDEYPEPPLMPQDSEGRAKVRMVEDFCDLHLFPAIVHVLIKSRNPEVEVTDEDKSAVRSCFDRIASYLGDNEYAAGKFSLADCALMAAFASADALGLNEQAIVSYKVRTYKERLKTHKGYKGASLISLETAQA